MTSPFSSRFVACLALALLLALGACRAGTPSATTSPLETGQPARTQQPGEPSPTPFVADTPTPTATPEPLALRVNGESITLAEFQAELSQLQAAQEQRAAAVEPPAQRQQVLDSLVDGALLAQGAAENGFSVDEAALQAEVDRLAQKLGGPAALSDWQARNGYSEAAFRAALRRSLAAAWQRDQVIATVPLEAEQVRARQILVLDEAIANQALARVQVPGVNFATYAYGYDPLTGGDLGWFPRGYLTQPEVETAAFALQPGEISPVVKSAIGYHIVQVVAREQRPLSPDALRALQHAALSAWLAQRRAASQVEVLLPGD